MTRATSASELNELLHRCKLREQAAVNVLYARYSETTLVWLKRQFSGKLSREECEEIIQVAWMEFFKEGLFSLDEPDKFPSFFCRIAFRRAVDLVRQKSSVKTPQQDRAVSLDSIDIPDELTPELLLSQERWRKAMLDCIKGHVTWRDALIAAYVVDGISDARKLASLVKVEPRQIYSGYDNIRRAAKGCEENLRG